MIDQAVAASRVRFAWGVSGRAAPRLLGSLLASTVVASALGLPMSADAGTLTPPPAHPEPVAPRDGGDAPGRDVLRSAFEGPRRAVAGTVAVVVLDPEGPFVSELDVSATTTGEMVVGRSPTFAVGRDDGDAWLAKDGTLLRLGAVDGLRADGGSASMEVLLANYDVHFAGRITLDTGVADAVDLNDRSGKRRERLFVDRQTGIVVRRETYAPDGPIRRLVAFTSLDVVVPQFGSEDVRTNAVADTGPIADLSPESLQTLGRAGWFVPDELPGGYRLAGGYALDDGGDSSLHLVYSDGLYSTSLYEQRGSVAAQAREGAVREVADGRQFWRWPGAQPERVLWTGSGMTFTAIGDATLEQLLSTIGGLPMDAPDGLGQRFGRGLRRVMSWLNPLG